EHLPALVDKGRFRADLLDRLCFEVINLPPLRVREGDIAVLADHFARRMAAELGWPRWPGFGSNAMAQLEEHDWPGNVRELRNVVERAVYRWDESDKPVDAIQFDPFASPYRREKGTLAPQEEKAVAPPAAVETTLSDHCDDLRAACHSYERKLLEAALARCRFNQRATAAALKLTYDQLRHALRRHDLLEKTPG
ncbi:helix-turn-helix domain-containing protein, partial [Sphingomonas sp.]|uniref:helix-turn-helix domain-containing protein n=1 Tax=Sphingomonas sp. TaxID=28214 RepID=UPI003B3AB726